MSINVSDLVARVIAETGYDCAIAKEEQPILINKTDLPKVFIGFLQEVTASEQSMFSEDSVSSPLEQYGQLDTWIFSVQIVSTMDDLIIHKEAVKDALKGWNPIVQPNEFSTFRSGKGSVQAVVNGRVQWFQEFLITVPTM